MEDKIYIDIEDIIRQIVESKCSNPQCQYKNSDSNKSMEKKCYNPSCPYVKDYGTPYINADTSHYCVWCGEPLEKTWKYSSKFDKRYEVIAKTDLESLKDERNRLRKQINNSWGIKFENWLKEKKDMILWTIASIIAIIFIGWIVNKYDFTFEKTEAIQILKDETSGKYGVFNNETKTLMISYDYDSISHRKGHDYQGIYRNYFYLFKDGKIGVADSTGKISINCELDATEGAYNGVIFLYKGEKQGLMDCYGHQIIPCEYQYVLWQSKPQITLETPGTYVGKIIPVKRDKSSGWELYDRSGRKIRGQQYRFATQTGNPSLIKVIENRRDFKYLYGIVDENGQIIIPCKYYSMSTFYNNRAWVKEKYNDPWFLINTKGERIITLAEDCTPNSFSEGLAAIQYKKKVCFCDTSGKLVIPLNYELTMTKPNDYYTPSFYNGKARVSYNGVAGYIDKNGKFTAEVSVNK